jgi:hypothetical protein
VFDKGEMNEFAEMVTLTEAACGQLKNLLSKGDRAQLLETHLPVKVERWLFQKCWTDESTMSDSREPRTLAEFIEETEKMAAFSTSDSHFLAVNSRTEFLAAFKTKKLIDIYGTLKSK